MTTLPLSLSFSPSIRLDCLGIIGEMGGIVVAELGLLVLHLGRPLFDTTGKFFLLNERSLIDV